MRSTTRYMLGVAAALALLVAAGCKSAYRSTNEVSIRGDDIVYLEDHRTGLCFAVLAVENPLGTKIRQVTMTNVPCEKLSGAPRQ